MRVLVYYLFVLEASLCMLALISFGKFIFILKVQRGISKCT